jgi:hypothetical protein
MNFSDSLFPPLSSLSRWKTIIDENMRHLNEVYLKRLSLKLILSRSTLYSNYIYCIQGSNYKFLSDYINFIFVGDHISSTFLSYPLTFYVIMTYKLFYAM